MNITKEVYDGIIKDPDSIKDLKLSTLLKNYKDHKKDIGRLSFRIILTGSILIFVIILFVIGYLITFLINNVLINNIPYLKDLSKYNSSDYIFSQKKDLPVISKYYNVSNVQAKIIYDNMMSFFYYEVLLLGGIILCFIIIYIIYYQPWTPHHEYLLSLCNELDSKGLLNQYFENKKVHSDEKNYFIQISMKKLSPFWNIQYTYPFIFSSFPPILGNFAIFSVSLLSLTVIIIFLFFYPLFFLFDIIYGSLSIIIFILICIAGITYSLWNIISEYTKFKKVKKMIYNDLIKKETYYQIEGNFQNAFLMRNLSKLIKNAQIPIPFSIKASPIITIILSIGGYLIKLL